jgi:TonB-dependent starch-binding outer membrane protein SusC
MKKCNSTWRLNSSLIRLGLLSIFFIFFSGIIYAEPGEEILDKKISITAEQKEVKTILNEISKLAEIKFVYSVQRIPARKKVSLLVVDQKVKDVLNLLLQPLDVLYYVSGSQIVLMKKGEEGEFLIKVKEAESLNKQLDEKEYF